MKILKKLFSVREADITKNIVTICGLRFKRHKLPQDQKLYHHLPIQSNKIVFHSFMNGYSCNPKYICEEIIRQKLPYELVWVVNRHVLKCIDSFPKEVRLVIKGTEASLKEYATARIWIENTRRNDLLKKGLFKRKGQTVFQTWHGSMGIKAITSDRHNVPPYTLKLTELGCRELDHLLSHSTWESERFKGFFFNHGQIHEVGHARNDILIAGDHDAIRKKVYDSLGVAPDAKLLLYVPTWRDDKNLDWMTMDYSAVLAAFEKRFGGKWVLVARMHQLMFEHGKKFLESGVKMINASGYPDIQELHVASAACISDYSSCIYDFLLTKKPGFIYAPDRQEYENTRGLYFPLSETPFPIAENNSMMVDNIENFDNELYLRKVEEFVRGKGCMDDGHAAERIVELIKNEIEGNTDHTNY